MSKKKVKIYSPIFSPIGIEPVYLGEFYGLDHETAKKSYEAEVAAGLYDDESLFESEE